MSAFAEDKESDYGTVKKVRAWSAWSAVHEYSPTTATPAGWRSDP
jgi:hypothetical protein